MPTIDFYKMTKKFLLGEGKDKPTLGSHVQILGEIISSFAPKTVTERNRVAIAKEHLREIRKHTRRIEERVKMLEEQVGLLEEEITK